MTPTELHFLLGKVAQQDRAAFAELYRATAAKLYGIILRIVRRREVADEVLQEVYVRIWQSAHLYDAGKGSVIAWLAVMARNRALDQVRSGRHFIAADDDAILDIADDGRSALEILEASEDVARLKACLDRLEPERRALVVSAYLDGASREALAERVGAPVGTIKTWLHRSLKQLKDCLAT